eukprot:m51a1_g8056 putative proteasome activator complex subunit 3 isoform x2 (293) ;mRNA; r:122879-123898
MSSKHSKSHAQQQQQQAAAAEDAVMGASSSAVAAVDIKQMRAEAQHKALEIVHKRMPQKVAALEKALTEPFLNVPLADIEARIRLDFAKVLGTPAPAASGAAAPVASSGATATTPEPKQKKRRLAASSEGSSEAAPAAAQVEGLRVEALGAIVEVLGYLKRELVEMIEAMNTVKVWIQLNIPRIEDGNNFGVNIQEETVSELGRAEDAGFAALENVTKYYLSRAKLVTKVHKYPGVEDYLRAVVELDQKQYTNLRLSVLDLRNNYGIIYDLIVKNLEKIQSPRGSNHMDQLF